MNFLAWLSPKMKLKRWLVLILFGIIIMCYSISQIIVLNVVEPEIILLIIIEFVISVLIIVFGILGIQKRTLEIYIESMGESCKKLEKNNIKLDYLIFDKKVYENGPKVVVIGGGSGADELIKGIKNYTNNITEIIAISDTEKQERSEEIPENDGSFNILPYSSSVKKSIASLSNNSEIMKRLLNHEFQDEHLKGLNFGDVYLVAMKEMFGNISTSIKKSTEVLNIAGEVVPVSLDPITVCAELTDGTIVRTKEKIPDVVRERIDAIARVYIEPSNAKVAPRAIEAINEADIIVIGPGKIYTDIIPILLVKGIVGEIVESKAKKVYIANIMTDEGQTDRYKLSDHIKAISDHVGKNIFEYCIADIGNIMPEYLRMYHKEARDVVEVDKEETRKLGTRVIQKDMSKVVDGRIRHDSDIIAITVMEIVLNEMKYDDNSENDIIAATLDKMVKDEKKRQKKNKKKKVKGANQETTNVEKVVIEEKKTRSKFNEKYQDRIDQLREADSKNAEEEKEMIENFFKDMKFKKDDSGKENSKGKGNNSEKGSAEEKEDDQDKFNTMSIHNIMRKMYDEDEELSNAEKELDKDISDMTDAEKARILLKEMNKLEKKRERKREQKRKK